jgi:dienelactone hydrolase
MSEEKINIKTADGTCDTYVYAAPDNAPAPAVIFYMDGLGIRAELQAMAERLASNGNTVQIWHASTTCSIYRKPNPTICCVICA